MQGLDAAISSRIAVPAARRIVRSGRDPAAVAMRLLGVALAFQAAALAADVLARQAGAPAVRPGDLLPYAAIAAVLLVMRRRLAAEAADPPLAAARSGRWRLRRRIWLALLMIHLPLLAAGVEGAAGWLSGAAAVAALAALHLSNAARMCGPHGTSGRTFWRAFQTAAVGGDIGGAPAA
jgi:hypothetical protein